MLYNSLSPLEAEMKQMADLFGVEQEELNLLLQEIEKMYLRLRVKSADGDGIALWETEYGIQHNTALTIEQRRANVLAKMNSGLSATKEMLENMVKQILDADDVKIVEYPAEYRFEVYVHTQFFEENINIADEALSEARPAHLAYRFINALYRKYKCSSYVGLIGCVSKEITGEVKTDGLYTDE